MQDVGHHKSALSVFMAATLHLLTGTAAAIGKAAVYAFQAATQQPLTQQMMLMSCW